MDLDRGYAPHAENGVAPPSIRRPVLPSRSTPLLRQCTALATRARVELLGSALGPAGRDLIGVLAEIAGWSPEEVVDIDPTMSALAAASLQDLRARVDGEVELLLGASIDATTAVLCEVMPSRHLTHSA